MVVLRFHTVLVLAVAASTLSCAGCAGQDPQYPAPATKPAALVQQLLSWEPSIPIRVYDEGNPYLDAVAQAGESTVPELLRVFQHEDGRRKELAGAALGTIGSPQAFEPLFTEYLLRPDDWLAIRAYACMDRDRATLMVTRLGEDEAKLRAFMRPAYGPLWQDVAARDLNGLKRDVYERLEVVRRQCREYAWPKAG